MEKMFKSYHEKWKDLHPIERATLIHCEFARIHPFIDGNGRTARLIMNLELMRSGFVPLIIHNDQRREYFEALQHYDDTNDYQPFLSIIEALEEEMLERYIEAGKACISPDEEEKEDHDVFFADRSD
jgi:Fic family protein